MNALICLESSVFFICGKQACIFYGASVINNPISDTRLSGILPDAFLVGSQILASWYSIETESETNDASNFSSQILLSDLPRNPHLSWDSCLTFLRLLSFPVPLIYTVGHLPVPVVSVQYELPAFTLPFMYQVPFSLYLRNNIPFFSLIKGLSRGDLLCSTTLILKRSDMWNIQWTVPPSGNYWTEALSQFFVFLDGVILTHGISFVNTVFK